MPICYVNTNWATEPLAEAWSTEYLTETQAQTAWFTWTVNSGTTTGHFPQTTASNYLTASETNTVWLEWIVDSSSGQVTDVRSNDRGILREISLARQHQQQKDEKALLATLTDAEYLYRQMKNYLRYTTAVAGHCWATILELDAERTAEALLLKYLTPEQRADYQQYGHFNVISMSRRRFRIRKFTVANVDEVDDQGVVRRLCCHPVGSLPGPDMMLAQKLNLELNEDEFLRAANVHYRRP